MLPALTQWAVAMRRRLVSDKEVADLLGCCRSSVWRLSTRGLLADPVRIGRMTRWKLEDVERLIANARVRQDEA